MQSNLLDDEGPSNFAKIFGLNNSYKTVNDLYNNIKKAEVEGIILPYQSNMIENILNLEKITLYDIMVHRIDINAVDKNISVNEALNIFLKLNFSKIPVYEKDIDSIIGICNFKELMNLKDELKNKNIENYIKKPLFVPETMKCEKLLLQMFIEKKDIAIVVDEYGGTSGIVTFSDIVNFVFKTRAQEHIKEKEKLIEVNKDSVILKGDAKLNQVSDIFNISFKNASEFDTIGGFLVGVLGRIPDKNEQPVVEYNGVTFKILSIEKQQIEQISVTKTQEKFKIKTSS